MTSGGLRLRFKCIASAIAAGVLCACPGYRNAEPNQIPRASAGADQKVQGGATVVLSGGGEDQEGDELSFRWSQLNGDLVALSDQAAKEVTFLAPERAQTLVFSLVAGDGIDESEPDLVQVRVEFNRAPLASAGGAKTVQNLKPLVLSAAGSDPDGDPIRGFGWAVESGPQGSELGSRLSGAESKFAVFTPDKKGDYSVSLAVFDGVSWGEKDFAIVTSLNNPPIADSGEDQSVQNNQTITLTGKGSDADGDSIAGWSWEIANWPTGALRSLGDEKTPSVKFTPQGKGSYLLRLTVSDGEHSSAPSEVVVQALNNAPTANAGPDLSVLNLGKVSLQGSATDPDADAPTFGWSVTGVPDGGTYSLSGAATANPLLEVVGKGNYEVTLTAGDGAPDAGSKDVAVVTALNNNPVANAGPDVFGATAGQAVTLLGSASLDPDGDPLTTYEWKLLPAGPTLSGATPSFTPVAGMKQSYLFQLVVRDGDNGVSAPDLVQVVVDNLPPVADVGASPRYEEARTTVTLDGTLSRDPDGTPVTGYQWTQVAGVGPTVTLSGAATSRPSFLVPAYDPDNSAQLKFELRVTDGKAWSDVSAVTVYVTPDSASYVFVSKDTGNSAWDGGRATPLASIGAALPTALALGRDVVVAAGATPYQELFDLKNGVSLYGGYQAGQWSRDIAANQTIIEDTCCRDFVIHAGGDITTPTIFDGFTVRRVNRPGGGGACNNWIGGLRCFNCSNLAVRRCRFTGIQPDGCGGSYEYSVSVERGSAVKLERNTFETSVWHSTYKLPVWVVKNVGAVDVAQNRIQVRGAYGDGFAVYLNDTTGVVLDSNEIILVDATPCLSADAVRGDGARSSVVTNNVMRLSGSNCKWHHGVLFEASTTGSGVQHDLNLIANNFISGFPNGSVWKEGVLLSINWTNGTVIANNFIRDVDLGVHECDCGAGYYTPNPGAIYPLLRSNSFHATPTFVRDLNYPSRDLWTSDLQIINGLDGGLDKKSSTDPDNAGNLAADCALVDEGGGDYRLNAGSPCIDRGDRRAGVPTRDYFGNPRPVDKPDAGNFSDGTDIGVHELP
ncbi:MAG: right-handed parallel beta-helix repeat-containing protein [Myxococcales bacterium]|nr:right-handed parallel beta-helix repeat-containing protein [Myxococcales bacterium]